MFGHQDQQHDDDHKDQNDNLDFNDNNQEPKEDAVLSGAPGTSVITAPPANDSLAGDYVAAEPHHHASPVMPPPVFGDADDKKPERVSAPEHDAKTDDLLDIKQGALHQLSPLIDHLDQTPEEKFRTMMMMIQASDDKSLIKAAYESAQKIGDEKERAQALLDIVNEINYFTQHSEA